MRYIVDFGTGVGNSSADSLDDAKVIAERDATYTQSSIYIIDRNKLPDDYDSDDYDKATVSQLPWCGVQPEEDDEVLVDFGDYGFYGEWIDF